MNGVPNNSVKGNKQIRQWHEMAINGDINVQSWLGWMYANGKDVVQSDDKAFYWYEKAALQGHISSQFEIGCRYAEGKGCIKNLVLALQWFEKAAAQGSVAAQFRAGVMYANGEGTLRNEIKACQWYEKAAVQGDAAAQNNLGRMYAKGNGVPINYIQARYWFEKAAAQGDVDALNNLGVMYEKGHGVFQDKMKARSWYTKAAEQGHHGAKANLSRLVSFGSDFRRGGKVSYFCQHDRKKGYIYILSNKSMPGIYKIGCTSRTPEERAAELYTTGVPSPFSVEYSINIDNYAYIEKAIHIKLSNYNCGKEFFRCDLFKCVLEIRDIVKKYDYNEKIYSAFLLAQVEGKAGEYINEKRQKEEIIKKEKEMREQREKEDKEKENKLCAKIFFISGFFLFGISEVVAVIIILVGCYMMYKGSD